MASTGENVGDTIRASEGIKTAIVKEETAAEGFLRGVTATLVK